MGYVRDSFKMPSLKINNTNIGGVGLPPSGQVFYWDTELKGFAVKATPSGRVFIVQRKIKGKAVRHIIGKLGEITPSQARDKAAAALAALRDGVDLNQAKRQAKIDSVTLAEAYAAFKQYRELRPKTIQVYDGCMRRYFAD